MKRVAVLVLALAAATVPAARNDAANATDRPLVGDFAAMLGNEDSPAPTGEPAVGYLIDNYGISESEAKRRIAISDVVEGAFTEYFNGKYGLRHGGIWIDKSGARLRVAVPKGESIDAQEAASRFNLTGVLDTVSVRYSLAELQSLKRELREAINAAHVSDVAVTHVDVTTNRLAVVAQETAAPALQAVLASFQSQHPDSVQLSSDFPTFKIELM